MNEHEKRRRLEAVLQHLADEIDVSPGRYQEAKNHYNAVGTGLAKRIPSWRRSRRLYFLKGRLLSGRRSARSATRNMMLTRFVCSSSLQQT